MNTTELFKLLSDENRFKIFNMLLVRELCICDIEAFLDLKQANVSKHMIKFKDLDVVETRKEAQWIYYKVSDRFLKSQELFVDYIKELEVFKQTEEALASYKLKKACRIEGESV